MIDLTGEGVDGGGMCVYHGGLLRVGRHEFLYDSVGHVVHIIVHFVQELGSDAGD